MAKRNAKKMSADAAHDPSKLLGQAISRLRVRSKITQTELSKRADMDQGAISRIERGVQDVTTRTIGALANGLGIKVSDIWAEAEGKQTSASLAGDPAGKRKKPMVEWDDEISALRLALSAMIEASVVHRPIEALAIAEAIRKSAPIRFLEGGYVNDLLLKLESCPSRK